MIDQRGGLQHSRESLNERPTVKLAAASTSGIHSFCGKFDRWALVKALATVLKPASLVDHAIEDRALAGEAA